MPERRAHGRVQTDFRTLDVGCPRQLLNAHLQWLQPNRLPNTSRARVPNRMRILLPVLFSSRFFEIRGVVVDVHDHGLFCACRVEMGSDVEMKG